MAKLKPAAAARIQPVPNEFADEFLDVIGADFRFDHAKGLAEWIKNSADAYVTTAGVKDGEQYIVLRFKQVKPKRDSVFACIDFVGMTKNDIDKALKVWGLSDAAKKGTDLTTYGGHGNGGKFYMRQMFEGSRFVTFRNGKLNVFGFDEKRRYGYAKGFEDVAMSLDDALKYAQIDELEIPVVVRQRWKKSPKQAGFTVAQGEGPERFSGKATLPRIMERLRIHPQARRLLAHKQVIYMAHGQRWGARLEPPKVAPRIGFEESRRIALPRRFEHDGETYEFRNSKYPDAYLELRTSDVPLTRSADLATLNSVDILGELGCIGSYRMHELGFMRYAPESEFIYGECKCPLLEDPDLKSVKNDREKLVDNEVTRALLEFIRREVESLAETMSEQLKRDKKTRDLQASSLFNQLLDKWKNRFMAQLTGEIFGGAGIGGSLGGSGGGGAWGGGGDGGSGDGKRGGEGGEGGGGAGDQPKRGPKFPRVLLSGHDRDPLDEGASGAFECDPRHPPVYQRDIDIEQGIYWINTSRPLADKIMDQYGSDHARWREYLFQRYVDIILKQSIHELERRNPDMRAGDVDNLIDQVTSRVHDAAAEDLETFLFSDSLTGIAAGASSSAAEEESSESEQ